MEQNKDHSGAAVRGEAVAESPCNLFIDEHGDWKVSEFDYQGSPVYFHPAPASARAVDAPYEPSEPTDLSHRLRETADQQPGWKQLLNAAADEIERYYGGMLAWKKTAEKKDADYNNERMKRVNDRIKSRAADALNSQPTDTVDGVRERVWDAVTESLRGLYYCGRVWSAWGVGTMGESDFSPAEEDDDIIANITDAVMETLAPASSQPTDGTGADHAA